MSIFYKINEMFETINMSPLEQDHTHLNAIVEMVPHTYDLKDKMVI